MLKREWGAEINEKLPHLFIPRKLQLCFLGLDGRPAFGYNSNLGSWVCSERPALGQNTLRMTLGMLMQDV